MAEKNEINAPGQLNNNLDPGQIIKKVYDQPNVPDSENPNAIRVRNLGGNLVPDIYNEIFLTYISGGAAEGEIATASYYNNGDLVATLMLEYYTDGRLKKVSRL
jgi:hypothetical protein